MPNWKAKVAICQGDITDVRMVCFTLGDLDQYERIFGEME